MTTNKKMEIKQTALELDRQYGANYRLVSGSVFSSIYVNVSAKRISYHNVNVTLKRLSNTPLRVELAR